MATISPITDAISAPPSTSLVLPPSGNNQTSATAQTEENASSSASTAPASAAQTQSTASTPSSATSASTNPSLEDTSAQPLDLVFDALATAGLDTAVDQTLLTPPTAQASGTFSVFMDQLFAAIAAQQAASAQAQEQAAASSSVNAQAAAAATAQFASNAASATPNSALEGNVQQLANQAQTANAATSTTNTAASTDTLTPLQQSFDEFVASAGGSTSAASLPTFLQALASNLHTVPTPLGNLVDSLS